MSDIVALYPHPSGALALPEVRSLYTPADRSVPCLRVNFVQSLDGSATVDGLSGSLGGPADKLVFDTLRGVADVVLAGAGTVRAEGYGALTTPPAHVAWRRAAGLPEHPVMALVSGRLDLDPESALFAAAPRRPLVFTTAQAPSDARRRLERVATVIDAGTDSVEPEAVMRELVARGLPQVLCEGGPSLFGDFIAADGVDEFCLTMSPVLEGGSGPRIARAPGAGAPGGTAAPAVPPRGLQLAHLLHSDSVLLTRWVRPA
ncbi:MAG: pyrimidine reductase family protein [Herbiconiux sp.]|nr:pyrimidine reductase family protein [Herbiconiux sp.]